MFQMSLRANDINHKPAIRTNRASLQAFLIFPFIPSLCDLPIDSFYKKKQAAKGASIIF
jgi:hypothetical protein